MYLNRIPFLLLLLVVMHPTTLRGQCTDTFSLGSDTTLCAGNTIQLAAGAGYQSYLWSTGSTSPSITVGTADTYSCTVTAFGTSGELVVNGNFSQGATGFTSDYVPGYGGTYGLLSGSATYATTTSPSFVHNNFYFFNDHTGGGGNMLVVNGAEATGFPPRRVARRVDKLSRAVISSLLPETMIASMSLMKTRIIASIAILAISPSG